MFSLAPRCTRRVLCLPQRGITFTAPTLAASPRRKRDEDDDDAEGPTEAVGGEDGKTFKSFLRLNDKYKTAKPRNWLTPRGVTTTDAPFPMNPSFKPPVPISDATRSRIYVDYMMDPETNSIRALSQRYHISLKRVEAILRLKGLEAAFVKGKELQSGFRWGMEMLLGVKSTDPDDRADAHAADMLEQEENRDAARQRFQRQYWESVVDDGKEPILPASLEHARKLAQRSAQEAHDNKSNPNLMPRFKDTDTIKSPRVKVQVVEREGRIPFKFVDVGGKFIDVDERMRRMTRAGRRHILSARKSEAKLLRGRLRGRTSVERARRAAVKREEREKRTAQA
ncbi:eukaryotic mitochondrial regulator protein-domain-containing protein [Mycena pura]|uniref:Eukaryotic mitochondrial regulator protein-domain-containing protein n=1 Tax=Mycena pura TaxID=153505 RepID=A0AAD6V5H4_9AGAR|nr:eukaryotic mitochondrial regulator protein-domain-containing protein [Mycena pura]